MQKKKRSKGKEKMPRYKRIVRLWCWHLSKRGQLSERIGLANRWAARHPKKFFAISVGALTFFALTAVFSLVMTYVNRSSSSGQPAQQAQREDEILGDRKVIRNIENLRQLDNTRDYIKSETKSLTDQGLAIKRELDSLMALPEKTQEDSLRIIHDYNNLEQIVDFLKNGQK